MQKWTFHKITGAIQYKVSNKKLNPQAYSLFFNFISTPTFVIQAEEMLYITFFMGLSNFLPLPLGEI